MHDEFGTFMYYLQKRFWYFFSGATFLIVLAVFTHTQKIQLDDNIINDNKAMACDMARTR